MISGRLSQAARARDKRYCQDCQTSLVPRQSPAEGGIYPRAIIPNFFATTGQDKTAFLIWHGNFPTSVPVDPVIFLSIGSELFRINEQR